jgi:hypothetical protein
VFDDGKSEGEVLRLRADRFVIGRSAKAKRRFFQGRGSLVMLGRD